MIIIADSGSTKVHWCLMTANGQTSEFVTDGINPMFQTSHAIQSSIINQLLPQISHLLWAGTVTHIYFYGAGCTPEKKIFVQQALEAVFRKATAIVESDMVGAARGLLGHNAGIACILGTGSGSCYYNGEDIEWGVPSMGYILGDEGSGATLGKRLVSDLFKNQLGDDLREQFLAEYNITLGDIFEKVYRQPFPNRYLASLSKFCATRLSDKRIHDLIYRHFDEFLTRNVIQYKAQVVSFAGSIAYYYKDILREAVQAHGLELGTIMQDPIAGLIEYHKDDVVPTQN